MSIIPEYVNRGKGIQPKKSSSVAAIVPTLVDSDSTRNTSELARLIKVLIVAIGNEKRGSAANSGKDEIAN